MIGPWKTRSTDKSTLVQSKNYNTIQKSRPMRVDWCVMRAFNSINGNMCRQYLSLAIAYNAIINISMLSTHMPAHLKLLKQNPKGYLIAAISYCIAIVGTFDEWKRLNAPLKKNNNNNNCDCQQIEGQMRIVCIKWTFY